jgi:Na+/H+ antiporter NhaD/arsenite permease-like protein
MAPLVIDVTRALRRNPVPYLLAVAMASNAGSAATFTGNPQNMIIGVTSHLAYAEFFARLAPAAAVALALTIGLIGLLNPLEFSTSFMPPAHQTGTPHVAAAMSAQENAMVGGDILRQCSGSGPSAFFGFLPWSEPDKRRSVPRRPHRSAPCRR